MSNHRHTRKAGLPPATLLYTGKYQEAATQTNVISYNTTDCQELPTFTATELPNILQKEQTVWINITGLHDTDVINQLCTGLKVHPLVIEDILNTEQRTKIEEYENYFFITLRNLSWDTENKRFYSDQISILFGKNFLITFQEKENNAFNVVRKRLLEKQGRLREQGSDYLAYTLLDTIVDHYFMVLDKVGEYLEDVEDIVITTPSAHNAKTLYHLKQQLFILRKAIWPLREVANHLLRTDTALITNSTIFYLRDVYDHIMRAIDTIETFRDMLAGMFDINLSTISNRMNEIMKVLTIISTIFIPITFIASMYGMNFEYMPEIHWRWAYPITIGIMITITMGMLIYFKRKKWF